MKFLAFTLIFCLMAVSYCQAAVRLNDRSQKGTQLKLNNEDPIVKKGFKAGSRLVGGSEVVAPGYAPWQVSVQNKHGTHICGGAIIGDFFVLTSASCMEGLDELDIRVITGTDNWMEHGAAYEVAKIINHCNFDKPLYHNDLAIIELIKEITYDENTQNITLADFDDLEEDEILTMTGWSSPEKEKPLSEYLIKTDYEYISNEDCAEKLEQNDDDVDRGHLCGQLRDGGDSCHGDGGAPLVNSLGDLVGIKIFGIPCQLGHPNVFSRVAFYRDWIRTTTEGCWLH